MYEESVVRKSLEMFLFVKVFLCLNLLPHSYRKNKARPFHFDVLLILSYFDFDGRLIEKPFSTKILNTVTKIWSK